MDFSPAAQQTINEVVERFVTDARASTRRQLLRLHEDPETIDKLWQQRVVRSEDNARYIPQPIAFHYCDSIARVDELTGRCVEALARVLKQKYFDDQPDLSVEKLQSDVGALDSECANPRTMRVGLYVGGMLGLFSSYRGGTLDAPEVTPTAISERILSIKDFENLWRDYCKSNDPWPKQDSAGGMVAPPSFVLDGPGPQRRPVRNTPARESNAPGATNHRLSVLISHSSKDKDLAERVSDLLRTALRLSAEQIRCTSADGYRLPGGAKTNDQLREEIRTAKMLIALVTPNSTASTYVLFELGARWAYDLPMIPLLAGMTAGEMRGPDNALNALECTNKSQVTQLVEDVATLLELEPEKTSSLTKLVDAVVASAGSVRAAVVAPQSPTPPTAIPTKLTVATSGVPPEQHLNVNSDSPVKILQVEYLLSDGACMFEVDVNVEGTDCEIPLNHAFLTEISNKPRPDRSTYDGSGPMQFALVIFLGKGAPRRFVLPVRLEQDIRHVQSGMVYSRKVVGSRTFYPE